MQEEESDNIISHADYSKICHVIRSFSDLNQKFGKEDINFPPYSSSRSIEQQKKHLNGIYQFVDWIGTRLNKDFRINIKSINDSNIYKLICEMRVTCDEI